MNAIDPKTVVEKYDEISQLEVCSERIELLNKQSEEMRIALWHENIDRKTIAVFSCVAPHSRNAETN